MGLYGFKPRFVPFILARTKKHTIRETRKFPDRPGSKMYLYTGLRGKKAKLISIEECVCVEEIEIWETQVGTSDPQYTAMRINGCDILPDEKSQIARRDGFNDWEDMVRFWDGRLPFKGHIFHWK